MGRIVLNPHRRSGYLTATPSREPLAFHRRLPGYAPAPLRRLTELAARLGVGEVLLADESDRFGLPAFKILGASWAVICALRERLGSDLEPWATLEELRAKLERARPLTFVAATDGNHGRAVARMAKLLGFGARIYLPAHSVRARVAAIESEGAEAVLVEGSYDDAVKLAGEQGGPGTLLVQDTSLPGEEELPLRVIEGYSTMFWEMEDELRRSKSRAPDLVLVQIGVGALAAAAIAHFRSPAAGPHTRIIGVEPTRAACALAAIEAGEIVTLPGPQDSIMAGLNCGTVAAFAWPALRDGLDAIVAVEDERCREAMRILAAEEIVAGESGAAGLAGLLELALGPDAALARARLDLGPAARVLVLSTEGATDPDAWRRIAGR